MRSTVDSPSVSDGAGIMRGVTVLELGGRGPVPFACSLLADHGARVVRIDSVGEAHEAVTNPRYRLHPLRRDKESAAVDLRDHRVRTAVLHVVEGVDVLAEGFRPGVAERLGLGPEDCLARNPRLVYARMGGWAAGSPRAGAAGHDINYIAMAGALGAIGSAASGPCPPLNLAGDYATGALLSWGIVAALFERERTGEGQVVRTSIYEGALYYMRRFFGMVQAGSWVDALESNDIDGGAPWYRTYRTRDDRFIAVGAIEDKFYERLVAGLGLRLADLPPREEQSNWAALRRIFAEEFSRRTRDEWWETFRGVDACVAPVLGIQETMNCPEAETVFRDGDVQPAPSFSARNQRTPGTASLPGTHTRSILQELGGLSSAAVDDLASEGAAGGGAAE